MRTVRTIRGPRSYGSLPPTFRRLRFTLAPLVTIAFSTVILGACSASDETSTATPSATTLIADGGLAEGERAPAVELGGAWFGTPGPGADDLHAIAQTSTAVLVEFWNGSCAPCIGDRDFVATLHERYSRGGLVVLSVHVPDFAFEEDPQLVELTVDALGIEYGVLQDATRDVWTAFQNESRPARYLIDAEGYIVHRHLGRGGYAGTEDAVRTVLAASGHDAAGIARITSEQSFHPPTAGTVSRDLYFGYRHNYHPFGVFAAQPEYYEIPEEPLLFEDPGPPREPGVWYAHGLWSVQGDALVHAQQADTAPGYVTFGFEARSIELVMGTAPSTSVEVIIQLDGFPLTRAQAGSDVRWDSLGRSVVIVDKTRIYDVVRLPATGDHHLRLSTHDEGLALYSASFSAGDAYAGMR